MTDLNEAKQIADALQFACRLPDKVPDFSGCGGPAAEAYWEYFTPGRVASLLGALDAALKLVPRWKTFGSDGDAQDECADELRETIHSALRSGLRSAGTI